MTDTLLITCLFLFAGVVAVPVASRLKLGSVLGYILAGILISPILLALKVDVTSLQHFAEFGVVMMLFLVGLELEPKLLWEMRSKLLGLGGLQVGVTAVLVTGIAVALGLSLQTAIAVGFVFALSSTAIVLQTLNEKGLMQSEGGQSSFSVLLFQDIAVIPMLAIIPLLAPKSEQAGVVGEVQRTTASAAQEGHQGLSLVAGLPGWQQALVTLLAIAIVVVGGIVLSRPFFRFAASAKLREILVATALLWVVAIALLMSLVELSPALGTFLAGVVLANSEYRHELESNINPFKGLLLGLFFITVGASINFGLFAEEWMVVIGLTFGVMALKAGVLLALAKIFKIRGSDRWVFSLGLAQAGEFAFVLLSFMVASQVMANDLADLLLLVVALSMILTPAAFIFQERFLSGSPNAREDRESDPIDEQAPIVIAGHGRVGGIVNRMLSGLGYQTTVLDYNYDTLEQLRKFGFKVYFGDATRPDLLHAAGVEKAKIFIIALNEKSTITELTKYVRHHYPEVHIIARAVDRHHVYELYAAGCRDIIRETFDSSVRVGRSALEALGLHPFEAERKTRAFVDSDKKALIALAPLYRDDVPAHEIPEYVAKVKELREEIEAQLQGKDRHYTNRSDRGWIPPSIKSEDLEQPK